ncbi:MAG: DciA family protein [bacterium]
MSKPTLIKNLLDASLKRAGVHKSVSAIKICEEVALILATYNLRQEDWEVKSFKDSTLTVIVKSSALAQELQFKCEEIKNQVNKKLKSDKLQRIIIRVGSLTKTSASFPEEQ